MNLKFTFKTYRLLLLCVINLMAFQMAIAQKASVTGKVIDETGSPIPGVSVVIKGTTKGTTTNNDGNYTINANPKDFLIFSFVGYITEAVAVNNQNVVNLTLKEDAQILDEVVAIGYGTQRKKEITGAVVQISNEVISKSSTYDIGSALQGQIAGVSVQASDGAPGSEANIQIRGINSLNGKNEPLFVVDGIPYSGDPKLSISEIETIDVLKDAASASIYGTRGSGGVILITTKKGKIGQMKVSLDGYYGIQKITSGVPRQDFEENLYTEFKLAATNNGTHYQNAYHVLEQNRYGFTNNTDYNSTIVNDNAPIQNYSLNISGGKSDLSYNINANYFNQQGSIINSSLGRFNVRANTRFVKNKFTFTTSLGIRLDDQDYAPFGLLLEVYRNRPYQAPIDVNATTIGNAGPNGSNDAIRLGFLAARLKQTDNRKGNNLNGNIQAEYQITPNLKYTIRTGGSVSSDLRIRVNPSFVVLDNLGVRQPEPLPSGVYNQSSRGTSFTAENLLAFNKKFGSHNLGLLAGYSMERYTNSSFFAQKFGIVNNEVVNLNGTTINPNAGSLGDNVNSLIGMITRAQYDYKGKYLLSVSARRDGSSRFSKTYRWGYFPSVSAGWNISDEAFMQNISDKISNLRLRASFGTTGNQNFANYTNAANIVLGKDYTFGGDGSDVLALGFTQTGFANANVKWETSQQTNLGLDAGFFQGKLTFSADVYNTNKKDMLIPLLLPPTTGAGVGSTVVLNVGDMTNKGLELAAGYKSKGKFSWGVSGTYSKNINTVTKMSAANKLLYLVGSTGADLSGNNDRLTVLKEGLIAGAFMLIPTNGLIKTQEELDTYKKIDPTAKIGDLRYIDALTVDTDGDGIPDAGDNKINDDDRVFMGSGTPKFELGLNLNADYKNFDFQTQWFGAFGGKVFNGTKLYAYYHGTHKDLVYQYTSANVDSNIPIFRGGAHTNFRGWSDYFLEDGSFVRLRNVSLGYTLSNSIANKMHISKLRVYVAAQNPITLTKYQGFNPEVGNDGLNSRGIDKGNYPISAQYRMGFSFEF